MANSNGKRKRFARIMAWVLSAIMASSGGFLLISLIIEMTSK